MTFQHLPHTSTHKHSCVGFIELHVDFKMKKQLVIYRRGREGQEYRDSYIALKHGNSLLGLSHEAETDKRLHPAGF